MRSRRLYALLTLGILAAPMPQAQTISLSGRVLTLAGVPIQGATVQFKGLANKATTDAEGRYSFGGPLAVRAAAGYRMSLAAGGDRLSMRLDRRERVAIEIFSPAGRRIGAVAEGMMDAGSHAFDIGNALRGEQLALVRVRLGSTVGWHKLTRQGGLASLGAVGEAPAALAKSASVAADSVFVTHPDYHGGLGGINGRSLTVFTGTQDFRMVSSSEGWNVCAPPYTFNFDNSAGALYYQTLIPDPKATNTEVLKEVCQSIWAAPADIPAKFRFKSYVADINSTVTTGVAATGGNKLFFNVNYINRQKRYGDSAAYYEVVGVLMHEAVHSYQPYYNTSGASGFGEAVPDAIRALTGFFRWGKGSKCSGSYTQAYQTGGKYWYFIEQKHPGFINKVYKLTSGDIASRVQQVTGASLSSLVSECQTKGMP